MWGQQPSSPPHVPVSDSPLRDAEEDIEDDDVTEYVPEEHEIHAQPSEDWSPPRTLDGSSSWQQTSPAPTIDYPSPQQIGPEPILPHIAENESEGYDDEDDCLDDLHQDDIKGEKDEHDNNFHSTTIAPTPTAAALMFLEQPVER